MQKFDKNSADSKNSNVLKNSAESMQKFRLSQQTLCKFSEG